MTVHDAAITAGFWLSGLVAIAIIAIGNSFPLRALRCRRRVRCVCSPGSALECLSVCQSHSRYRVGPFYGAPNGFWITPSSRLLYFDRNNYSPRRRGDRLASRRFAIYGIRSAWRDGSVDVCYVRPVVAGLEPPGPQGRRCRPRCDMLSGLQINECSRGSPPRCRQHASRAQNGRCRRTEPRRGECRA